MINTLYCQLALDFCCAPEDVADDRNHFHVFEPREGRRRFQEPAECFLKVASLHGKLLFTGREDILRDCEAVYREEPGEWFMDGDGLCALNDRLRAYGWRVGTAHPFFLPAERSEVSVSGFDVRWYEEKAIEEFRDDIRFSRAFSFDPDAPDRLGVAAVRDGEILGMAGASADSPTMWQIGIDVVPSARGSGVASLLVALLKDELLSRGILPFYGTAMSHILSQKVALRAGFRPAWAELVTERVS